MQSDEDSVERHCQRAAHERSRKEPEISYKYLGGLTYLCILDQGIFGCKFLVLARALIRASSLRSPAFLTNNPPDCLSVPAMVALSGLKNLRPLLAKFPTFEFSSA